MDLINRQEIHDNVAARYPDSDATQYSIGYADAINDVLKDIQYMPSAEPEIIRCKDCKFVDGDSRIADGRYWCGMHHCYMYYCSDAKRRTDE